MFRNFTKWMNVSMKGKWIKRYIKIFKIGQKFDRKKMNSDNILK